MTYEESNERSCDGKKIFLTWKQATTYNHRMHRRGSPIRAKGGKLDKLHVYRCLKCKYFHLGHETHHTKHQLRRQTEVYRKSDKQSFPLSQPLSELESQSYDGFLL